MTLQEIEAAIQTLVEESSKMKPLTCWKLPQGKEDCTRQIKHYGVPFDRGAARLCPACAVAYHAAMARNALIEFIRRGGGE